MGKVKKKVEKEQNQKSISSFFKTDTSKSKESKLFSTAGSTSTSSKLSLKKPSNYKIKFTEISSHESGSSNSSTNGQSSSASVIDVSNGTLSLSDDDRKIHMHSSNGSNSNKISPENFVGLQKKLSPEKAHLKDELKSAHSEPNVIPETQFFKSPAAPREPEENDSESGDLSDIIIPDTPESDSKLDVGKQRRVYGRSFLTAGRAIGKAPGLTKKELMERKLERKKMSKARKKGALVSVNFNSPSEVQKGMKHCEQIHTAVECDDISENEIIDELINAKKENEQEREDQWEDDSEIPKDDKNNDEVNNGNETPTKTYCNNTVKRMSRPGLSPSNKRAMISGYRGASNHEDFQTIFENTDVKETVNELSEMESAKRNLMECDDAGSKGCNNNAEQRRKIKPDPSELNRYQLTMRRSKGAAKVVSTKDDECLAEILENLHQPSLSSEKNTSNPCDSKIKFNSRKSLSKMKTFSTQDKPLGVTGLEESLTTEEMKYFDELDDQIHPSVRTLDRNDRNMTSVGVVKQETSGSVKSSGIFIDKTRYVSLKSRTVKSSGDNKHTTQPVLCADTENEMKIHAGRVKGGVNGASQMSGVLPSQNIKEFCTQRVTESSCDHPDTDMDITDFPSQAESNVLCENFKHLSPFKNNGSKESCSENKQPACVDFGRHTVLDVEYIQGTHELAVDMVDFVTEEKRKCILSGFWADTKICEGDVVHVLTESDGDGTYRVLDKRGLIIVNPDLLLSGTTVVSSVFCKRKSVLNEKFKGCDKGNIHMLYGSIIHYIFQQVLRKRLYEESQILKEAEETIKLVKFLHEIYGNSITEEEVMDEIKKYIPPLQKWIHEHTNIGQGLFGGQRQTTGKTENVVITKIKDIEENIWSPRFGVKGKIDMTVEVKVHKTSRNMGGRTVPLELKTGRPSFSTEHKGQVTLYSMMSSDRRDDPEQGLLLYLKEPDMKVIPADHLHKGGLIQLRNEMAYYLSQQVRRSDQNDQGEVMYNLGGLPEPINNPRACIKCPHLLNCAVYQQEIEQRTLHASHTMRKLVPETLAHLSASHLSYFKHWCLLLNLEQKASHKSGGLSDLWCKTAQEREIFGTCMSGFILEDESSSKSSDDTDQVIVKFKCKDNAKRGSMSANLALHDFVIVSAENSNHIAVCTGSVTSVSANQVELLTERESLPRLLGLKNAIYCLDKYDNYNTSGIFFTNLSLLLRDDPKSAKLRELIIDKRKPTFQSMMSKGGIEKVKKIFKPLNKPQKAAILKILMSKDYVLIKGYPGTGKTSTVVALVKVLVILGYSVLLTSYTHSAVDNILLKLRKDNVDFVRLGRVHKVHPALREFCAEEVTRSISSVADLRKFYSSQKIVATSCLGMNHPVFSQRKFDFCIMDEASQALQLATVGPLFMADRFILVGDPKQLPPVIRSKEAREFGMDESLFARLDNTGATFELNLQYRMNKDIMQLSNHLVYQGALKCGSDVIANRKLEITPTDSLQEMFSKYDWLRPVISADPYQAAVFLDTNQVPAPESRDKTGLIKNIVEAQIVQCLTEACIKADIGEEDIGVIAPYSHQVALIKERLSQFKQVEVNTVDQYQGRDKDVIMISFTRSFPSESSAGFKSGELLKDIRRLNVAITRAKKKLILVGNIPTLKTYPPLATVIQMMQETNTIVQLPCRAHIAR